MASKLSNRTVSQVNQFSNWSQDLLHGFAALVDFGFYTFNDLDFFDKNNIVLASFPNFSNEDVIQTGSLVRLPSKASGQPSPSSTDPDVVRLYYAKNLATAPASSTPEIVSSALLGVELTYNGSLTANLIPTDSNGTKILYGIARLGKIITPAQVARYKTVETSPGNFEQVFLRNEDYWYAEDDIFAFEDAFQHDIYGNVVREVSPTTFEDSQGSSFTRYKPILRTETWDVNTTYYYLEIDTVAEATVINNELETGLNWGNGLHGNPPDAFRPADTTAGEQVGWSAAEAMNYTWKVTAPAWTQEFIVINEARNWTTDKFDRFS